MYTASVAIIMSSTDTGLTLSATLIDTTGVTVAGPITSGFVEIGSGIYMWTYSLFPAGFRGGVKFLSGVTLKAFIVLNPSDVEYLDVRLSSRASLGSGSVSYTHTVTLSGVPVDGASVWVTASSSDPSSPIASGTTDDAGQVTFLLDPGTYYVWVQRGGGNFPGPTTITVS